MVGIVSSAEYATPLGCRVKDAYCDTRAKQRVLLKRQCKITGLMVATPRDSTSFPSLVLLNKPCSVSRHGSPIPHHHTREVIMCSPFPGFETTKGLESNRCSALDTCFPAGQAVGADIRGNWRTGRSEGNLE